MVRYSFYIFIYPVKYIKRTKRKQYREERLREVGGLSLLTFMGLFLILVGLFLVFIPFIVKLGVKLENIHPLLLVWRKIDGFYIGTSPLLLIILVAIYLLLILARRPM